MNLNSCVLKTWSPNTWPCLRSSNFIWRKTYHGFANILVCQSLHFIWLDIYQYICSIAHNMLSINSSFLKDNCIKLLNPTSPSIAGSWDVPLLKHLRRPDSIANWCPNSHDFLEIRMAKGYPTKGSFQYNTSKVPVDGWAIHSENGMFGKVVYIYKHMYINIKI